MRIMNARNFRREFPTLGETVMVVSKERLVGTWTPNSVGTVMGKPVNGLTVAELAREFPVEEVRSSQATRDKILRRINKGG